MKTLKNNFLMPIVAVIFAITASAFTATSSLKTVDNIGYLNTTVPCSVAIECAPSGNDLCEQGGQQAYGKFVESQTTCPRLMYRP